MDHEDIDKRDHSSVLLPFVMTVRPFAWVVFPLGLCFVSLFVWLVVPNGMEHKDYMPVWGYLLFGGFFLYCYVVIFWSVSKVRCDEAGIELSLFSITYTRIPWVEIVKVEMSSFTGQGQMPVISISRKPGIGAIVSRNSFREKDIEAFLGLLRKHAAHAKFRTW